MNKRQLIDTLIDPHTHYHTLFDICEALNITISFINDYEYEYIYKDKSCIKDSDSHEQDMREVLYDMWDDDIEANIKKYLVENL